mmetsp:Transcript_25594/g.73947  ORF Transcript_25594/g.73947 Transcript_25594/m.73947 type:complete len:242 (-) Transcript_25594:526-1251(-)
MQLLRLLVPGAHQEGPEGALQLQQRGLAAPAAAVTGVERELEAAVQRALDEVLRRDPGLAKEQCPALQGHLLPQVADQRLAVHLVHEERATLQATGRAAAVHLDLRRGPLVGAEPELDEDGVAEQRQALHHRGLPLGWYPGHAPQLDLEDALRQREPQLVVRDGGREVHGDARRNDEKVRQLLFYHRLDRSYPALQRGKARDLTAEGHVHLRPVHEVQGHARYQRRLRLEVPQLQAEGAPE